MIAVTFRPIDVWPGTPTPERDRETGFTAPWSNTLNQLDRELRALAARDVVVQLALKARDIRNDGWPRADARVPEHPGVILAFGSKHGPLKYSTDRYRGGRWLYDKASLPGWQCNLRAITLGLEALRKVDRYGITRRGEQYTGWSQLPPGATPMGSALTLDAAAAFLSEHSIESPLSGRPCFTPTEVRDDAGKRAAAYRYAARLLHPDAGGDTVLFQRLEDARRLLDEQYKL